MTTRGLDFRTCSTMRARLVSARTRTPGLALDEKRAARRETCSADSSLET